MKQTSYANALFVEKLCIGRRSLALFVKKQSDGVGKGLKCQGKCQIKIYLGSKLYLDSSKRWKMTGNLERNKNWTRKLTTKVKIEPRE